MSKPCEHWRKQLHLPTGVGVDGRIERALKIAQDSSITPCPQDNGWTLVNITSQSDPDKRYVVAISAHHSIRMCNCPDFKKPHTTCDGGTPVPSSYNCKHIIAVRMTLSQEDIHQTSPGTLRDMDRERTRATEQVQDTTRPTATSRQCSSDSQLSSLDSIHLTIPPEAASEVERALLEATQREKVDLPAAADIDDRNRGKYVNHVVNARRENGVIFIE